MLKQAYARTARASRSLLGDSKALAALDRWAGQSRTGNWLRSLLAVYDLPDLVALDLPWWTFDAGEAVAAWLAQRRGARVFEWGSGASTLWLARRAASVISVEHDPRWADQVRPMLPGNATVRLVPAATTAFPRISSAKSGFSGLDFADYVAAIDGEPTFDLIVVDGRAREACFARALDHLAADGLLVFDNVERRRYRNAMAAADATVRVRVTSGLTPCLPYPTRTALVQLRS